MKFLSVTNKKTHLHKSPADLSIIATYEHDLKGTVSTDISLLGNSFENSFVQIYKTNILEVLRLKKTENGADFVKMRKIHREGVNECSGGKSQFELAVGRTCGDIYIYDLKGGNVLLNFPAEPSKASVISLDFNCDGTYLSSVYENGLVNIFGIEKKIKSTSMKLEDVIFARYHPTRKFHLAMSSFKGKVSIMDLSCKKTVFLEKNAHDAPCREISIPEDIPDRLLTCGCDSFVKIYDMRKKAAGIQIQSNCGFTTISSSKCGGFFVVGNLKGDLISYDMRDLKKPLSITKGDGVLITRVAFLKENFEHPDNMEPMSSEHAEQVSDELPDPPEDQDDFSCLEQILEINKGRPSEFDCSSRVSAIGNHKVNEDRRGSALFGHNLANAFNFSINLESNTDEISLPESPSANFSESMKRIGKKDSSSRRRSSYLPSCLQLIHEENGDKENLCLNSPNALSSAGPRFSSTPASSIRFNNKDNTVLPSENLDSSEEIIDVDALDSFGNNENSNVSQEKQATLLAPVLLTSRIDFNKEFEAVRDAMRFEIQSLNFDLSGRHIETMTYVFNQRKALENRIARIEDCIGILMNEDAKIARVMDLIEENASLKVQLSSAFRQIKNFQNNEVPKTE